MRRSTAGFFSVLNRLLGCQLGLPLPSTVKQAVAISGGQILVAKASSSVDKSSWSKASCDPRSCQGNCEWRWRNHCRHGADLNQGSGHCCWPAKRVDLRVQVLILIEVPSATAPSKILCASDFICYLVLFRIT